MSFAVALDLFDLLAPLTPALSPKVGEREKVVYCSGFCASAVLARRRRLTNSAR